MTDNKRDQKLPASSVTATKASAPKDIAILAGPTEDGQGARLLRIREGGEVSTGEIRPLREGEPLNQSEVVRLHPLDADQRVCAVEVLHKGAERASERASEPQQARSSSTGPARVSNAKYRENWSAIFGAGGNEKEWALN